MTHFLRSQHRRGSSQKRGGGAEILSIDSPRSGESHLFDQLVPFLRTDAEALAQGEVTNALGISEGALRVRLHRFCARYRQILQAEVAASLAPGDDIAAEIAYLRSLFV